MRIRFTLNRQVGTRNLFQVVVEDLRGKSDGRPDGFRHDDDRSRLPVFNQRHRVGGKPSTQTERRNEQSAIYWPVSHSATLAR